jgi:AcrR family transcriptional regulator
MTKVSLKVRQRKEREEAILNVALDMMAAQSYAAMKMEDLADQVGLSKGSLYLHFPSKEALAVAVLSRKWRDIETYLQEQSAELPAIRRLEDVLRWMLCERFTAGWPDILEIKPALAPWIESHPDFGRLNAAVTQRFGELFEAAKSDGDLPTRLETTYLVHSLWSQARAYGMEAMVQNGVYTPDQLADELTNQYFAGLRA